jgi:hypothetical protein
MHQLIIGRHLFYYSGTKEAESQVMYNGMIDGMKYSGGSEYACTEFLAGLPACLWTIITGSNLLFGFIVFDSVGDKKGFGPAMWSSVVTIATLPFLVYLLYKIAYKRRRRGGADSAGAGAGASAVYHHDDSDSCNSSSFDDAERPLLY